MKRTQIMLILLICFICVFQVQLFGAETNAESAGQKAFLKEPVVEKDDSVSTGQVTSWSCITFGTYPQTEIIPASSHAVDEYAVQKDDFVVNPDLYAGLQQADWNDDETEIDGIRYRRLSRDAAVSSSEESAGHYRWGQDDEWHYFRYDPVKWRVLEVRDGTALLLSDMAVDCEPFQTELKDISWEDCTLRSYLNGYGTDENISSIDFSGENHNFLDMAFSPDEQDAILRYPVRNEDNYYFGTDCGDETSDKIFIPAESELFIYDSSVIHGFSPRDAVADRARQFQPTDYAVWKGAWSASQEDVQGNVFWITRTMGYTRQNVVYIDESGYMFNRGILATCPDAAVIPALILDLDSSVYGYVGTCTIAEK